ncbi:MAG: type 1 glutamine amidotransferase [Jatrophihabitantaceae bacterium]
MGSAPLLVLQLAASDPVGRLGEWLTDAGVQLELRRPDELPGSLDGFAGLLVLGGPMSAGDDAAHPWLATVRALLREAVARELPALGVCLGAQLLAAANGGRVARNPHGPEFGAQLVAKRASSATDPLFGRLPITPDVIQWHFDAVVALPPGAVQLASSPGCEQQAFRLGRVAWGIQFHIETTPDVVRAWAAHDAEALAGYDVEAILARADAVHDDIGETWTPFAAAFAAVVRDPASVRTVRTVATATAAPITDPAAIRAALAAELSSARRPSVLPDPGRRPPDHG